MGSSELRGLLVDKFRWVKPSARESSLADLTGWWAHRHIIDLIGPALAAFAPAQFNGIVMAPQSSGYLLGPLVARSLGVGFIGASKTRRDLSDNDRWVSAATPVDYRGRNLELHVRKNLVDGHDVFIIDDWVATGGQALALRKLAERAGGTVVGVASVVDALASNQVRREIGLRSLLNVRELPE